MREQTDKARRQRRYDNIALGAGLGSIDMLVDDLRRHRHEITISPWMVDRLADAERSIRQYRLHLEALLADEPRTCAKCHTPMGGRSDRKFCSDKCRIKAHLSSKRKSTDTAVLAPSRAKRLQPLGKDD